MANLPEPTNGWTRAEMNDHLLHHLHELQSALSQLPDWHDSELQKCVTQSLEGFRSEARDNGYWLKRA